MYYPEEVRKVPEYGAQDHIQIKPQEIELAEQLVKKLAAPFHPERYEDEYKKRVMELVEAKTEGKQMEGEPKRRMAPVIDLMQALQKSLGETGAKKKPATPARATTKQAKARRRAS
jgi:DNA end-binding protein Ku